MSLLDFWLDLNKSVSYIIPPLGGLLSFWGAMNIGTPENYYLFLIGAILIGCGVAAGLTHYLRDVNRELDNFRGSL